MRLYLVRHGESDDNLNQIHQGHRDSKLTKKGILQAKSIGERLKNEKFDYIYSSDLDRTIKTAKEILKYHPKLKLEKRRELREQSKGIYEGVPYGAVDKELEKLKIEFYEFKPEKGESLQEVWDNMVKFYNEIRVKHKDDCVLVVCHGGPIACLITYLHGDKIKDFRKYTPIGNTAITVLDVDIDGKVKFHILNCKKHAEHLD